MNGEVTISLPDMLKILDENKELKEQVGLAAIDKRTEVESALRKVFEFLDRLDLLGIRITFPPPSSAAAHKRIDQMLHETLVARGYVLDVAMPTAVSRDRTVRVDLHSLPK